MRAKHKRWLRAWYEHQIAMIIGWGAANEFDRLMLQFDRTVNDRQTYRRNKANLINDLTRVLGEIQPIRSDLLVPLFTRDVGDVSELRRSIRDSTMIMPLLVRPLPIEHHFNEDRSLIQIQRYEIICGYRRYVAATSVGMSVLPCIVKNINNENAYKLHAIENLHRKDFNPIEEAQHYRGWRDNIPTSEWGIAMMINKSQGYISNRIRLLNLPLEVQTLIAQRKITPEHGRVLLNTEFSLTPQEQIQWASLAYHEKISIRELENRLRAGRGGEERTAPKIACQRIRDLTEEIQIIKDKITNIYKEEINSLASCCLECDCYELCNTAEQELTPDD